MQPYFAEFSTLMLVFLLLLISPGADLAMVMRQALIYGRKNACFTAFGIGTALMLHVTYTILGLGFIISRSLVLFNLVKWAGVIYLVYIGIKALCAKGAMVAVTAEDTVKPVQSVHKAFLLGFTVNMLNPKAVLFFLSIFSTFVAATTPGQIKCVYGGTMAVLTISWFMLVSFFLTTPVMRRLYARAAKWIDRMSGTVFVGLGIRLMFQKASS